MVLQPRRRQRAEAQMRLCRLPQTLLDDGWWLRTPPDRKLQPDFSIDDTRQHKEYANDR